MLNFKRIKQEDYEILKFFLSKQEYRTCDYTQLGLFMWADYFCYEYAIDSDTLFLRSNPHYDNQHVEYLLPLPLSLKDEDVLIGIERIIDEEKNNNSAPVSFSLVPDNWLYIFNHYNCEIKTVLRDRSDYIYSIESLSTLVGKKLSKKRNLIHQFINKYPDYSFVELNDGIIEKVKQFHKRCFNMDNHFDLSDYENYQVSLLLENYNQFNLCGGALLVDGRIIAFCIGEIIKEELFIHVEKADRDYKGSYQMMNWLFAKSQHLNNLALKTVNREEDMGDAGLRQAKMSYYPGFIKKFKVVLSNEN